MNLFTEAIIIAIIGALAGLIAGWLQSRGSTEHLHAQAAEIYQKMAIKESEERDRLEAEFDKKIAVLRDDNEALTKRLAAVKAELSALKLEKEQWMLDRDLWEREREEWALEREAMNQERETWKRDREALEAKITVLQEDIRKLKKTTGSLNG